VTATHRDRSRQKNFQLIVITHDKEFVDMLGQAGYTEHYFKVSKEVGYASRVSGCALCECLFPLQGVLPHLKTPAVWYGALRK